MSNETREVRGKVPAAMAERIEHAMKVLGAPMIEIVGKAVENGLEEAVCELARHRAAELAAFLPPETTKPEVVTSTGPAPLKPGRAERQAAVRAEELKEQRRRQRSPAKSGRDPVD